MLCIKYPGGLPIESLHQMSPIVSPLASRRSGKETAKMLVPIVRTYPLGASYADGEGRTPGAGGGGGGEKG